MRRISIIVPVYKDDKTLCELLHSLEGMDIAQIIISDGEARSALPETCIPPALASICEHITAPKGRGPQIKAGLERARAEYVCVLHADSRLDKRATSAIRAVLANPETRMGTFTLTFDTRNLALRLFAWVSRADTLLTTFGDQGFFFRHEDYAALDLDLSQFPLLEDVALRKAFKASGRLKRASLPIVTSSRRFAQRGVWATQVFNAQILWRYCVKREDPAALYAAYYALPSRMPSSGTAEKNETPYQTA